MSCTTCSIGTAYNPGGNYVGVRMADAEDGKTTLVFVGEAVVRAGERIIVEGDDGPEFAQVTTVTPVLAKPCSSRKARRFLRLASDSESADFAERTELQREAYLWAAARAEALDLDLSLVKCLVGFDRRKMTVLYSSEERVNTRDLAREMSEKFRTRVDMKSVGVRDETKLLGGMGPCGLTLCCSTWLRGFHPVTIRMAKLQGITPNPSKLTGMCGRLKCCLAYELEGGIEAARKLGSKGPDRSKEPSVPPPVPPAPPAPPPVD
jgi:cell fate regulator YaaT (PSP1 superfamily)